MNRITLLFIPILLFLYGCSTTRLQPEEQSEIAETIDKHAIEIKDTDPNTELDNTELLDDIFKDIRVFGFGEATHGTQEFSDVKVKLFKYLVKNQGVKNFAMEVSYGNAVDIDDYIKGKEGHANELLAQTDQWISNTEEVLELIKWMRSYNTGKTESEQLSFYGIDIQDPTIPAQKLVAYIESHPIKNGKKYKKILNQYTSRKKSENLKRAELKDHLDKMIELEKTLKNESTAQNNGYLSLQRSILQFINFRLHHTQETRDKDMAENVRRILDSSGPHSKVFIWAHNFHVEKEKITFMNTPSMGSYLKEWYGTQYYSVGFEFARGTFNTYNPEYQKTEEASIVEPPKDSRSALFSKSRLNNFFLDFKSVAEIQILRDYLQTKTFYLGIGSVYHPKMGTRKKLQNSYDGIIFIKESHPTTLLKKDSL